MTTTSLVPAEPSSFSLVAGKTALIVIDMQRDFLLPGGFGSSLGNDVDQLAKVVPPLAALIAAAQAPAAMRSGPPESIVHPSPCRTYTHCSAPSTQTPSTAEVMGAHRRTVSTQLRAALTRQPGS